jgi:hypothetical protein
MYFSFWASRWNNQIDTPLPSYQSPYTAGTSSYDPTYNSTYDPTYNQTYNPPEPPYHPTSNLLYHPTFDPYPPHPPATTGVDINIDPTIDQNSTVKNERSVRSHVGLIIGIVFIIVVVTGSLCAWQYYPHRREQGYVVGGYYER